MKDINFCDHLMILHHQGVLFWPEMKLAVVSDLHLEKGSYYAELGQFVPPHDTYQTLLQLKSILDFGAIHKVVLLGDSFHDNDGYDRMSRQERDMLNYLCNKYELIWIIGNHDNDFALDGVKFCDEITIEDVVFRHEHQNLATNEISGHYHPKAYLKLQGKKVTRPCFIHDDKKLIMPAFGAFTGGLNHNDPVIQAIFTNEYYLGLLGQKTLYYFKGSDIT